MDYVAKFQQMRQNEELWEGSFSYSPRENRGELTQARKMAETFGSYRATVYRMIFGSYPVAIVLGVFSCTGATIPAVFSCTGATFSPVPGLLFFLLYRGYYPRSLSQQMVAHAR